MCASAKSRHRAKPFEIDELGAITLQMKANRNEGRIEKLHTFSQLMLPAAALLPRWRAAHQLARQMKKPFRITKPRRRRPRSKATINNEFPAGS